MQYREICIEVPRDIARVEREVAKGILRRAYSGAQGRFSALAAVEA